jgi:guanylate kinase
MDKKVVVIAGPTGSGKDSIIQLLMKRYSNFEFMVNAATREPRPGEQDGVNYHFFTNEKFKEELAAGNIPEHYHREETDTYYGTYKPDLDARLARGKIVLGQLQIVGAKYLKEHYGATTIFIMPSNSDAFEKRIRERAPMSDAEWSERQKHTAREIEKDAPFYDYCITNEEDKLEETVQKVVEILEKEGYELRQW